MVGVVCEMGGEHPTPQIHKDDFGSERQTVFFRESKGVKYIKKNGHSGLTTTPVCSVSVATVSLLPGYGRRGSMKVV